ncbi:hypothetical protein [Nonomuraea angiospora]|uniref:hypothetical protein n=1 Tax=Nonomuraea angiospora TaxID=46172 RepID=UPI0029B133E4|nr:hypothetical protein [Nonomuraea angiospora]MDX3106028.1 hypothetical protein [Nonomuraea angiospora]
MGKAGYIWLALSIGLSASLGAGIVMSALGVGLAAAVGAGGATFVAIVGLVILIMQAMGLLKP